VKKLFSKIRHAGIDSDTDQSNIKCITLTNTVAFLLMLLATGFIPLFLFYLPATEYITYVFIICAGFNLGVVILNYYRKYTLSVIFFASFSLIFCIISSISLGRESNFHYFIICSLYLIYFVFPLHKKKIMYLFISLFIVSFVGLEVWFVYFDRLMNAEPLFFEIVRYGLFFGIIFFVFVISYHAYNVINFSEHALKEERGKVEKAYSLLSKYVAPQLADTITDGQIDLIWKHYRKKLTLFFSDIKNFTTITDSLEPEDMANVLNEYLTEMNTIINKYRGTLAQVIGDGLYVFFGAPDSKNDVDNALQCVNMAIDMQLKMKDLNRKWFNTGIDELLQIRCGINTGMATVGGYGSSERKEYTAMGMQTNIAARLEQSCEPGGILISHTTWALVKDEISCSEQGKINMKGLQRPIRAYSVDVVVA
jgi:class 3 adenylate cyclase